MKSANGISRALQRRRGLPCIQHKRPRGAFGERTWKEKKERGGTTPREKLARLGSQFDFPVETLAALTKKILCKARLNNTLGSLKWLKHPRPRQGTSRKGGIIPCELQYGEGHGFVPNSDRKTRAGGRAEEQRVVGVAKGGKVCRVLGRW